MDAALKQKWTAALRGGGFRQGKNALHHPRLDAYCCLGVLCIVGERGDIIEAADYDEVDRLVGGLPIRDKLTVMNDRRGSSFSKIADWIDANIPADAPAIVTQE